MRVLLINTLFPPIKVGGAEESVFELARDLGRGGHDVTVAALGHPGRGIEEVPLTNVTVRRFVSDVIHPLVSTVPRSTVAKAWWHLGEGARVAASVFLRSVLRETQPDVVHTNSIAGFGTSAWRVAGSVPLVHTVRDYYLLCVSSRTYREDANCTKQCGDCRVLRLPQRAVRRHPDLFVGVSEAVLARHRALGYLRPVDETAVVYNDPVVSYDGGRGAPPKEGTRYGFLGRLDDYKGIRVALEAFSALRDPSARLVLAGDGSPKTLAEISGRLARDRRISYPGRVDKTWFYDNVDVVLVPSQWHEPYGRVAGEAVRAGRRVLVSGLGGLPEAIRGWPNGMVVADWGRAEAWTTALEEAARRPGVPSGRRADAMGSVADQYLALYERVLSKQSS